MNRVWIKLAALVLCSLALGAMCGRGLPTVIFPLGGFGLGLLMWSIADGKR